MNFKYLHLYAHKNKMWIYHHEKNCPYFSLFLLPSRIFSYENSYHLIQIELKNHSIGCKGIRNKLHFIKNIDAVFVASYNTR